MGRLTSTKTIKPAMRLTGSVRMPGDKSISHRYAMLAAAAVERTRDIFLSSQSVSTLPWRL
jgi:3-phosphoshikimate 1-carboxyvinyltransferase